MPLGYFRPDSVAAALAAVRQPGARPIAGGTDLLVSVEAGIAPTERAVDLAAIAGLSGIRELGGGALAIGAATRLEDIARRAAVRERYAALADAASAVGTPALRAMGTIGGNLCQRPRCWYLRSRFPCLKNGGSGCPAADGENQYHAILGDGPCRAAHPSDLAVALLALDASVVIAGANGERRADVATLYASAASDPEREAAVAQDEIIVAVELPAASAGGTQQFTKLMQRGAWDFATVSLAAVKREDGTVRLVLGGVAAGPWRVNPSVEEDVASGELDDDSVDALAERALYDAQPLAMNGYKVEQAATLLKRAMRELSRA